MVGKSIFINKRYCSLGNDNLMRISLLSFVCYIVGIENGYNCDTHYFVLVKLHNMLHGKFKH